MLARDFFPTSAQPVRRTERIQLSGGTVLHCNCRNCQMIAEPGDYRCVVCHDIGLASNAHGEPDELKCPKCSRCEVCALPVDEQPDVCPFVVASEQPASTCIRCDDCGKCADLCVRCAIKCDCPPPVCTGCTSTEIKPDCPVGSHRYQAALDAAARRGRRRR